MPPDTIAGVANRPKKGTSVRGFRIDDDVWFRADAAAKRRGVTVSDVVRQALRDYAADPEKWADEHPKEDG